MQDIVQHESQAAVLTSRRPWALAAYVPTYRWEEKVLQAELL
jgi:hypothetical protein